MKTQHNDKTAAIEILNRAAQVLELTYFEWQLHEETDSRRRTKKHRTPLAMRPQLNMLCMRPRSGAFA